MIECSAAIRMVQMKWINLLVIVFLLLIEIPAYGESSTQYRSWIEDMKSNPRGPFSRIRWFCKDGSILEPRPYACADKGGGVQHGEWTPEVKTMRRNGYSIANVFADLTPEFFTLHADHQSKLKQMMLEQFLIQADNGWIFRKARYYRGALQAEGEAEKGKLLLEELMKVYQQSPELFLLLREAVRLLPHHLPNVPVSQMRQMAVTLSEADENFRSLRTKIHVQPDGEDAQSVRTYAQKHGKPGLDDQYEHLAENIEAVFQPADLTPFFSKLAKQVKKFKLSEKLYQGAEDLSQEKDLFKRFNITARLIASFRDLFYKIDKTEAMLSLMDLSILLEGEAFRLASDIFETVPGRSMIQLLHLMEDCTDIAYGTGLISGRQQTALRNRLLKMSMPRQTLGQFRSDLMYVSRASEWSEKNLLFHFSETISLFQEIEPVSKRYVHDRLHSSLLLLYSSVLEQLMKANSQQFNLTNRVWRRPVVIGINGLNSGLARGILRVPDPGQNLAQFSKDSILILPATTSDLPPVAGIITAGEGNILSHIQLLARNLGIPNISVDKTLLPLIQSEAGREVVLAVSPKGIVRIEKDSSDWDLIFEQKADVQRAVLKADTEKLDLKQTQFVDLGNIRAGDSGRIAGPKAANLGELKHHFPEAVTEGVIIPFGVFRKLLDQPLDDPHMGNDPGVSMFDWMKQQYQKIEKMKEKSVDQQFLIETTLERIRSWILTADPGQDFKQSLEKKLAVTFGPDSSYGVFVRSDTNVEDLPGFTGAGLNLTVPHVVGFENVLEAVKRVWASPFTLRSFGWRQSYLENPEHVYASVLLMKTVPVEKSGVMVTRDIKTGDENWLTIAVNEGIGGAVSGQTAEELKVHILTGQVTLLSQATEPLKRVILASGGMGREKASGTDTVLTAEEISQLITLAKELPERFPVFQNSDGQLPSADVEFGFLDNKLVLFQIRPLVEDGQVLKNRFLSSLDNHLDAYGDLPVDLNQVPLQELK